MLHVGSGAMFSRGSLWSQSGCSLLVNPCIGDGTVWRIAMASPGHLFGARGQSFTGAENGATFSKRL